MNFLQARKAKEFYEEADRYAETRNQAELQQAKAWNSSLCEIDGKINYVKFFNGLWYRYVLENKQASHIFNICNGVDTEEHDMYEIEEILGDIDEANFFVELDISPIEKYIEELIGVPIKLKKKYGTEPFVSLNLYTDNLVEHSGICKAIYKEITISCKDNHIQVNSDTGKQELKFNPIVMICKSRNGDVIQDFGLVEYDLETKVWKGYFPNTLDAKVL